MAINILEEDYKNKNGLTATSIEVANGDLDALKRVAKAYGLSDVSDVFAFAIGVLSLADGGPIAVTEKDGHLSKYKPSESLVNNESI